MGEGQHQCNPTEHDYIPLNRITGTILVICRKCGNSFTIN